MPISLSRLCENTEKSYQLRLIAGRDGLDNPVRWVHMIEDPEVTGFIHGNENGELDHAATEEDDAAFS